MICFRLTREPTLGRSRSTVPGLTVTAGSLAQTSWPVTRGNIWDWNLSFATSAKELSVGQYYKIYLTTFNRQLNLIVDILFYILAWDMNHFIDALINCSLIRIILIIRIYFRSDHMTVHVLRHKKRMKKQQMAKASS